MVSKSEADIIISFPFDKLKLPHPAKRHFLTTCFLQLSITTQPVIGHDGDDDDVDGGE